MRHRRKRLRHGCIAALGALVALTMAAASAHEHAGRQEAALRSLIDAELAFARMGSERGIREAFLANFSDDGIVFEPAPARLRETWSARPAPADPLAVHLAWKPAQAGVSRSLDMGYTTGPFTVSGAAQRGPSHGVFLSVWQRRSGGPWKVMLDAGIATPAPVDFAALGAAPRPHFAGRADPSRERARILDAEARALHGSDTGIAPNDYVQRLADDARLHRNGAAPVASRASIAPVVARAMAQVAWTPIDARVSAAADMAFTYGRYREADHDDRTTEGFYAHLWLRDAAGAWRLAYDIALPSGR